MYPFVPISIFVQFLKMTNQRKHKKKNYSRNTKYSYVIKLNFLFDTTSVVINNIIYYSLIISIAEILSQFRFVLQKFLYFL